MIVKSIRGKGRKRTMKKEITYTEKNGYLYPDLELPEQEEVFVGIWGGRDTGDI